MHMCTYMQIIYSVSHYLRTIHSCLHGASSAPERKLWLSPPPPPPKIQKFIGEHWRTMSLTLILISPLNLISSPSIAFTRDDLPAPTWPTTATNSPLFTVKFRLKYRKQTYVILSRLKWVLKWKWLSDNLICKLSYRGDYLTPVCVGYLSLI